MTELEAAQAIQAHFLDRFGVVTLFVLTVIMMVAFIEAGFRVGSRPGANHAKAQHSQVRAVMGAALGLTAFMLAFTFATAQTHYETRIQTMVEESRLANDAFLLAEFMPEPYQGRVRQLLRDYLGDRVRIHDLAAEGRIDEVLPLVARAELLHRELWTQSVDLSAEGRIDAGLRNEFNDSVIGLMDTHSARLEAALLNRIPYVIWVTLYLTGALSMLIMGYQAGLVGRRSPLATVTLAVAFAAVMMLITDLDRPFMSLFHINNTVMIETVARMDALLGRAP